MSEMDCIWFSGEKNLIPAGNCLSQTSRTCVINVDLIFQLIFSKASWTVNCMPAVFNLNLTCSTSSCKRLNSIGWECGKGKDEGQSWDSFLTLNHFTMTICYLSYYVFLFHISTSQLLVWAKQGHFPCLCALSPNIRLCLAVWSLTKHLAAFNSLTVAPGTDVMLFLLKTQWK